jgi:hypothetical protein
MFKKHLIKILGVSATVLGLAATVVSDWVNERKMDEKIEKKVAKLLLNSLSGKES